MSLGTKNIDVWLFPVVLEGLETSGMLVRFISAILETISLHGYELWPENQHRSAYAHIEIVVTFLVVNFFGFLVIARYPTMRF